MLIILASASHVLTAVCKLFAHETLDVFSVSDGDKLSCISLVALTDLMSTGFFAFFFLLITGQKFVFESLQALRILK